MLKHKKSVNVNIEERNKIIEQNHGLVISFLSKNHLTDNSVFDYYGAACIGLIRAAEMYDESLGIAFSTYAITCIDKSIRNEYAKLHRKMEIPDYAKVYVDKSVPDGCNIEEMEGTIKDFLIDTTRPIEDVIFFTDLAKIYRKYTNRERDIICDGLSGIRFEDIGKKWGVSKQRVSQILEKFKKDVAVYEGMCKNEA